MAKRMVTVQGSLHNSDTGTAIFQAKIRYKLTRTGVQSNSKGEFSVALSLPRRAHELRLVVLKPKYWPLVHRCQMEATAKVKDCGEIGLRPVEGDGWVGKALMAAAMLYSLYLSRTRLEQLLMVLVLFF